MHIETQFSIFMVNKPGVLAKVLNEFATAKINLIAITMMDSVEHGVLRMIGASKEKIRLRLDKLNMQYNETNVLCINLPNHAGALASVTQKLAEAHISISYAYCTAGARGGRTTGVLKVADVKKAIKILQSTLPATSKKKETSVRRSPTSKR